MYKNMPLHFSAHHASALATEEVARQLNVDLATGLSTGEADIRRNDVGRNEFSDEVEPLWKKFIEQLKEPMIISLLISAAISTFLGQTTDAISITAAVFLVCIVAFIQNYQSEKALESLKKLMPPRCNCLRDGSLYEFEASELVPGDVVYLGVGDRVPADLRLFESVDLQVDESNLTGEVDPVRKHSNILNLTHSSSFPSLHNASQQKAESIPPPFHQSSTTTTLPDLESPQDYKHNESKPGAGPHTNLAFSMDDECGPHRPVQMMGSHDLLNIAFTGTLVRGGNAKGLVIATGTHTSFGEVFRLMQSEEAPRTPLQKGMDRLSKQISMISLVIIIAIVLLGLAQQRKLLDLFTIGVSLAVAAVPEGLPIVVTVTLAIGQKRMAARNAIVKKLPAVETLGCVNIICTDKTGTITKNEMTATRIVTSALERFHVTGVGYNPHDGRLLADGEQVSGVDPQQNGNLRRLIEIGCLCNNASIVEEHVAGQPTEGALLVLAAKASILDPRKSHRRLKEWPFSSETKLMVVNCTPRHEKADMDHHGHPISFFVKGCPDSLIRQCAAYRGPASAQMVAGAFHPNDGPILPMTEQTRQQLLYEAEWMGNSGLRVLGLAEGSSTESLIFLGLVGLLDPPRPGVENAIRVLNEASVHVVMITGDSKETACSIGQKLGIFHQHNVAMSGGEVEQLDLDKLAAQVPNITVFYRTSPKHKCKIVKAIQKLGLVVAMTGDGVNDAVAVKSADVGVAMGRGGTDVCKEAADIVLVENDFGSILAAMEEGKVIFHNIRNFVRFQLSTSISALLLIALSTIMNMPSPLNAMQILYINILMDGPPAQCLGVEPADPEVVRQPPRKTRDSILNLQLMVNILISSSLIVAGTLSVFYHEMLDSKVTRRDTTMCFTCFVLFDIFNALSCRSQKESIFKIGLLSNRFFIVTITMTLVVQLLVIYEPFLQEVFQTEAISFLDLLKLVALASTVFWVSEVQKFVQYSPNSRNLRLVCLNCGLFAQVRRWATRASNRDKQRAGSKFFV